MSVTFCNTDILAHSRIASELLQPQPQTGSCPLNTFRTKMFYLWRNAGFTYSRAREAKTSGWFQTQRSNLCHGERTYAGRWWIWNWGWPSEPAVRRSQEPRGSHCGSSQACQDGGSWRSQHPFLVSQSDCYHRIQNQVEDCNHCFSPSVLPVMLSMNAWIFFFIHFHTLGISLITLPQSGSFPFSAATLAISVTFIWGVNLHMLYFFFQYKTWEDQQHVPASVVNSRSISKPKTFFSFHSDIRKRSLQL